MAQYSYTGINKDYITCFMAPEIKKARKPTSSPEKTSLAGGTYTFNISTDAVGSVGAYIHVQQICGNGVVATCYGSQSLTGFSASTGASAT